MSDNRYYVVEFVDEAFKEIKGVTLHRNDKDFIGTLDFLKSKISDDRCWELVGSDSEKFIYIAHLYQYKHRWNIKEIAEELVDIHRTIQNNLDWLYEEIKEPK